MIGAIDGTLIPIIAPNEEEISISRKGTHCINVLVVVDANMKFTYIVSKFPGSTHDAYIWMNSALRARFEDDHIDGILLGDSG